MICICIILLKNVNDRFDKQIQCLTLVVFQLLKHNLLSFWKQKKLKVSFEDCFIFDKVYLKGVLSSFLWSHPLKFWTIIYSNFIYIFDKLRKCMFSKNEIYWYKHFKKSHLTFDNLKYIRTILSVKMCLKNQKKRLTTITGMFFKSLYVSHTRLYSCFKICI